MADDKLQTAPELAEGWSARLQELIDSDAPLEEIAALMFESAMLMGAMALDQHPLAENFLTGRTEQVHPDGTSRFIIHTVRYLDGKGPDQHIAELKAAAERLKAEHEFFRSRALVTEADVRERDINPEKAIALLSSRGHEGPAMFAGTLEGQVAAICNQAEVPWDALDLCEKECKR